jgi:S-formylglutathione hydrolase FrmB
VTSLRYGVAGLAAVAGLVGCSSTGSGPADTASSRGCTATTDTVDVTSTRWGPDLAVVHVAGCPTDQVDVVYLLHGANADRTQWTDIGVLDVVDTLIEERGGSVAVVIPDATGAYRCRERCEAPIADYVLTDLEPLVTRHGLAVGRRVIAGISRGGLYALGVVSARPDAFAAVAAHSPAAVPATTFEPLAGTDIPIWLDVGEDDPLAPSVADLASTLDAGSPDVTATFQSGAHDRAYWRAHVPDYVAWYLAQLAGSSTNAP